MPEGRTCEIPSQTTRATRVATILRPCDKPCRCARPVCNSRPANPAGPLRRLPEEILPRQPPPARVQPPPIRPLPKRMPPRCDSIPPPPKCLPPPPKCIPPPPPPKCPPPPPPRRLSRQGSHERHNRGQHDCANCNSAIFHEYLPPAAEKSDGPRHTPRYEMAACAALTYINIAKFTGPELNAHNSRPILDE